MSLVCAYVGNDYAAIAGEGKCVILRPNGDVHAVIGEDTPKFFPLTPRLALTAVGSKAFADALVQGLITHGPAKNQPGGCY
jgi:hypothetical protein